MNASTNGFGLQYSNFRQYKQFSSNWGGIKIELNNLWHKQEILSQNLKNLQQNYYKHQKVNYALNLKAMYSLRYPVALRRDKKTLTMNWVAHGGLNLSYLWPVYIKKVIDDPNVGLDYIEVKYNPELIQSRDVYGRASWKLGFGEGFFVPGLSFELGTEIIWGNYASNTKVFEIGIKADFFQRKLPIMYNANVENYQIFTGIYSSFALGMERTSQQ